MISTLANLANQGIEARDVGVHGEIPVDRLRAQEKGARVEIPPRKAGAR